MRSWMIRSGNSAFGHIPVAPDAAKGPGSDATSGQAGEVRRTYQKGPALRGLSVNLCLSTFASVRQRIGADLHVVDLGLLLLAAFVVEHGAGARGGPNAA